MAKFGANFTIPVFVPGESKWERWLRRFEGALAIMKVTDDKLKATYLLHYVGEKAHDVLCDTFGDATVSTKKYEELTDKLKEMYASVTIEIAENFKFNCRKQQLGESVQDFAMALKKLGASCGFGDFLQKALRNQFVYGLSNQRIQNRLLETKDLTFEKASQIANATELCEKETTQLRGENTHAAINTVYGKKKIHKKSSKQFNTTKDTDSKKMLCYRCGNANHKANVCTLPKNIICNACKKQGHLEKICMQKGNTPRQIHQIEEDSHVEVVDILNVFSVEDFQNIEKFVRGLNVNNTEVNFEVDTGVAVSIMFYDRAKQLFPGERVYKSSLQLVTYCKSNVCVRGFINVCVLFENVEFYLKLYLTDVNRMPSWGREWIRAFIQSRGAQSLFASILSVEDTCENEKPNKEMFVNDLKHKYKDVIRQDFSPILGLGAVTLTMKPDAKPVFVKSRSVPF
ncbi:uncharacterized protein LOC106643440 [Copidosoma floridanum]|uniref:uncharacterized protein LOC106643440 n=1 Tax=Copidosoma floridanum TaxID=29053 RepID=UPI0006C977E8|nr:uncharacterized protein LOC106643440 [Copidosoma floridanum]